MAPEVGFEPTTNRLTADRSTTELLWIVFARLSGVNFAQARARGKKFGCGGGPAEAGRGLQDLVNPVL